MTPLRSWPWRQGQPVRSVRKTHFLKREKFCKVKKNCHWFPKVLPFFFRVFSKTNLVSNLFWTKLEEKTAKLLETNGGEKKKDEDEDEEDEVIDLESIEIS